RMDRESFWFIQDKIRDDDVFRPRGKCPQQPVHIQLGSFLAWVGSESGEKASDVIGIAEGTAYLYFHRVSRAIRNRKLTHLAWPGTERRKFLKECMAECGFPGCIGVGDGSHIPLLYKP
ncbi:hypothetical protein JAAARDRAFT_105582, partial [Jaapia argillacea MUCL 33604]